MKVKEYEYIRGNTAAQPRRSSETDRKRYEELQKAKRERKRRKREEERRKRRGARQIAAAIAILGFITIARDTKVYSMQNDLAKLNSEIKSVDDENEALRVELLKVASLDNIKTNAEEKLGMVVATKDEMLQMDLSGNYFEDLENDETNAKDNNKSGLFAKIMDALD
ncbi:MAG: cell division protein FtsL [Clostridium sp.]|uniref:Cell division protein FtsL n=1 Tax=Clostridium paraputrificum TaxID=29363 RepID=A0A6N3DEH5_9CLOT|nr:cell division protein FtsL [Clostridium sp.]MBS5926500.1 cell division protein FtsL [Clostridium sp.]MBS5985053.1 cell division protein FtsL [Clostridium sp.]